MLISTVARSRSPWRAGGRNLYSSISLHVRFLTECALPWKSRVVKKACGGLINSEKKRSGRHSGLCSHMDDFLPTAIASYEFQHSLKSVI